MALNPDNRQYLRKALDFSAIGLEMGISVAIGVYLGHLADTKFGIEPWGVLCGIFIGLGAAGMALYKAYLRLKKMENEDDSEPGNP